MPFFEFGIFCTLRYHLLRFIMTLDTLEFIIIYPWFVFHQKQMQLKNGTLFESTFKAWSKGRVSREVRQSASARERMKAKSKNRITVAIEKLGTSGKMHSEPYFSSYCGSESDYIVCVRIIKSEVNLNALMESGWRDNLIF